MLMQIENLNIIGGMNEWSSMNDWVVLMLICQYYIILMSTNEYSIDGDGEMLLCGASTQSLPKEWAILRNYNNLYVCVCVRHQHN